VISVEKLAKAECVIRFLTSDKEGKEETIVTESKTAAASDEAKELPEDVEITGITIPATRYTTLHCPTRGLSPLS
jgi:hypothetical protein